MEKMKRITLATIAILLISVLVVTGCSSAEESTPTIGYVTKSASNQGWILINQGAADAAAEEGYPLITLGPAQQGSLEGQLATIEDMITRGVAALALAPVDSAGVAPAVESAMNEGIPVVAVDTAVDGTAVTSFVATDNLAAARMQGEWVADNIADDGEMILVNGLVAQSTGRDRRDGFLEALQELKPGVTVYQVDTEWSQEQAQAGIEDLLQAHPDVSVIANAWDGATMGAIAALKGLGHGPGDITIVGFDGAPNALQAMRDGWVQANTAQQLYKMGYDGIKIAIAAAKGEDVEERVDTGAFLVLPENVEKFIEDNKLGVFMPQ
jgi:ribose transport system substrate-binding protein